MYRKAKCWPGTIQNPKSTSSTSWHRPSSAPFNLASTRYIQLQRPYLTMSTEEEGEAA